MAKYIARRIEKGALKYSVIVPKWKEYKDAIDEILKEDGYAGLIEEI